LQRCGPAWWWATNVEQAQINLRAAAMRNPVDIETHVYLAAALVAANDHVSAQWEVDEIRSLASGFSIDHWLETYPMTSDRQRERLSALLARVPLSGTPRG
jgi:hypothetical protein